MTGWNGYRILYFGDHVFSDLAVSYLHDNDASLWGLVVCSYCGWFSLSTVQDPIMQLGWKTGAIIPELQVGVCTVLMG